MRKHNKEIYCFHPSPSWVIPKTFCRNLSALIGRNCLDPQHLGCNHARAYGPGSPFTFRSGLLIPTWSMSEVYFLTVPSQICLAMDFVNLELFASRVHCEIRPWLVKLLALLALFQYFALCPKGVISPHYSLILARTRPLETWFTRGVCH